MINPAWTFDYRFEIQSGDRTAGHWQGQGSTRSTFMDSDGLVGPEPRCEVASGWLTLRPTGGFAHSLAIRNFSDYVDPHEGDDENARLAAIQRSGSEYRQIAGEAFEEAAKKVSPKDNYERFRRERDAVRARLLRSRGWTRDLASFALFVGDSLAAALQQGDVLMYSRDFNGDYHYRLERGVDVVFSAGTVDAADRGGPIAIWQESDEYPNPHAEDLKKFFVFFVSARERLCGFRGACPGTPHARRAPRGSVARLEQREHFLLGQWPVDDTVVL